MARPGVVVTTRDAPPASGPPIRTGTAFMAGRSNRGRGDRAERIESIGEFVTKFGPRQVSSYLYDAVDVFFREGGGSCYISRVVGDADIASFFVLQDATNAPSVRVQAIGPGSYANTWTVSIAIAGGVTTMTIKDGSTVLETITTSDGKSGLLNYEAYKYVAVTDADPTKGDPKVVTNQALAGGADDATIVDADWDAALARFTRGLGPGQVLAPGETSGARHASLLSHAANNNRVALLDAPDSAVLATIEAAATAARATGNGAYGAMFAPFLRVPTLATGAARKVPYSAVQAGLEARRDRLESQNVPAAGRSYPMQFVMSLVTEFTDDQRTELIGYGINTAHTVGGLRETYGYRSLADPSSMVNWLQFNYARLRMAITARGEDIGESFLFEQIDGKGLKLSEFGSAISGMLLDFYVLGSLYGDTPGEAFRVDVGSSVNTAETIAAGELHAVAAVRMSPHAEMVVIEFVKTPITQAV